MESILHCLKKATRKTISVILALSLITLMIPLPGVDAATGDVTGNMAFRVIAYDTSARIEIPYISGSSSCSVYFSTVKNTTMAELSSDAAKSAVSSNTAYVPTVYAVNGAKDAVTPANILSISQNTTYYFYLVTNGNTLISTFETRTSAAENYWTDTGNYDTSWYDGGTGPFSISTSAQLAGLASLVNSGTDFLNKTVNLTASLDMSAFLWRAIGTGVNNYTSTHPFRGTFDGKSNVIKGLHSNKSNDSGSIKFQGLFGYNDKGTIKNVGVIDGYIRGDNFIGGVAGENNGGTITNCYNTSTIVGKYAVGGVAGQNQLNGANAIITDCYNTGNVTGATSVGGIAGSNMENGGGYNCVIINCFNTGSVTGSANQVGGIAGYSRQYGRVVNCYNSGSVSSATSDCGGIIGLNWSILTNCCNSGSVNGATNAGGIAGASTTNPLTDCYNKGSVNASTSNAGGIVGLATSNTISNSYNTGTVTSPTNAGGVAGSRPVSGATIANTYYLTGTAAIGIGSGTGTATVKTSAELKALAGTLGTSWIAPLANANASSVFRNNDYNQGYPVLCSFGFTDGVTGAGFSPDVAINPSTGVITIGTSYGDGTIANPYIIRNVYQFDLARNSMSDSSKFFKFANNLDLSPVQYNKTRDAAGSWIPFSVSSATPFTPGIDGDGHSVSGIYINKSTSVCRSLIGCVTGTIKNIGVSGGFILGDQYTAGVVGYNLSGTVTGCYNSASIVAGNISCGGVVGGGNASNCFNTGSLLFGYLGSGGVVGTGSATNCYNMGMVTSTSGTFGGVVGSAGTVNGCYNTGFVSGPGTYAGGVIGRGNAVNSYNTGTVLSTGASSQYVGGIVGQGDASYCYNTGAVTAVGTSSQYVGGVVGQSQSAISYCFNTGAVNGDCFIGGIAGIEISGTISDSYNTGAVNGDSNIGGIAGQITNGTLLFCYNTGIITATGTYAGGIVGYKSTGGTISNSYYCGSGTGTGSGASGTTPFSTFVSNSIKLGGSTTVAEQSGLNSNSSWKTALGAGFAIAYSAYAGSPSGIASITGSSIQGIAIGSTTISGTLTITQNDLTSGGFTGPTQQHTFPLSLGLLGVTQATPTVTVSSITSPAGIGVSISLTATITNGSNPSGTVTFYNGASQIGSPVAVSSGTASQTFVPNSLTGLSITAVYNGDANNAGATSAAVTATVSKRTPGLATPVVSPATPQTYPVASVTLTSTLSNYFGTVSGQAVDFYNGATLLGTGYANGSGVASITLDTPGASTYNITAKFTGDTNNNAVTSTGTSYTVNKGAQTSLVIGGVPSELTYGASDFTLSIEGGSGSGTITYSSSNTAVLTVNASGLVTVVGAGSAVITVAKAMSSNYNSTSTYQFVTVEQKELTATITPNNKAYDRTTSATIKGSIVYSGIVNGDDVTISGGSIAFVDKTAGSSKQAAASGYVLNGAKKANYVLGAITVNNAEITAITLTVINTAVKDKTYNGSIAAEFSGTPALSGVISGDDVVLGNGVPTFADKNYSSSAIAVNFTNFSISGADSGNYSLTQPASVSANISKRSLGVSVDDVVIYCGQAIPALSVVVNASHFVTGEDETTIAGFVKPSASQSYGSTSTAVSNAAMAVSYSGGNASGNYQFSYANTAHITIQSQSIQAGDYQVTGNYSTSPDPTSWNTSDLTVSPNGAYTQISLDKISWVSSLSVQTETVNGAVTFYLKKADGTQTESATIYYNLDKTAPTGTITIHGNDFMSFINSITFGLFFKSSTSVAISGADTLSGVKTIEYQKVPNESSYDPAGSWMSYSASFNVPSNEKFEIYARITDHAGKMTVINSNGVVVYTDSALASASAYFDKDVSKPNHKDIPVTMTLNGNALKEIKNGSSTLLYNTDYTVSGNIVTLKKEYLIATLGSTMALTFYFDPMGETYVAGDVPSTSQFTVISQVNADSPDFIVDLSGEATYTKGDIATALSVNAAVTDSGDVTYQWYINAANATNGTAIDLATGSSFIPKTGITGIFFYYVKATNTNHAVNGDTVTVTTSGIYKITVNNLVVLESEIADDTPDTTFQGDAEDVKDAVVTDTDKEKLAAGSDISIYLKVEKIETSQADQNVFILSLDGKTMGQYLDISLIKNIDGVESNVTQTNNPIRIVIAIPEELRGTGRAFSIVRVHDGIAVNLPDLDNDPNTITIETSNFSTYAIVYSSKAPTSGTNPPTGDASPLNPFLLLSFCSLATMLCVYKKWSKKNRKNRLKS